MELTRTPVSVYLDSSDYSTLSGKDLSDEFKAVRRQLLEWSEAGSVEFRYSCAHVCEMAPVRPEFTAAAVGRMQLLVDLCGRRTFVSIDKLIREELKCLAGASIASATLISDNGEWFPASTSLFDGVTPHALPPGGSRAYRRLLQKNGNSKKLLEQFPMKPDHMAVLWNYMGGLASEAEAETAMRESLRDPTWVIKWFAEHSGVLSPLNDWLRAPSRTMNQVFADLSAKAAEFRGRGHIWDINIDNTVLNVLRNIGKSQGVAVPDTVTPAVAALRAPGLSTSIRTAVLALQASLTATPRAGKDSDFLDATHALHCPYVDVFRTDGFMAPLIEKATDGETCVVGRLKDLVPTINKLLSSGS